MNDITTNAFVKTLSIQMGVKLDILVRKCC